MTKLEKLYAKARRSPGSVRFSDLDRLLRWYGFTVSQPRGGSSHFAYTRGLYRLVVPKRGSNSVLAVYVRQAMDVLTGLSELEDADDDEE